MFLNCSAGHGIIAAGLRNASRGARIFASPMHLECPSILKEQVDGGKEGGMLGKSGVPGQK
jgi:hypothetical protein